MRLLLHPNSRKARVLPQHIVDYEAFKLRFGRDPRESGLHLLEKYHAARSLIENGCMETFVESTLLRVPRSRDPLGNWVVADVCGKLDDELKVVFCETAPPTEQLYRDLGILAKASNARAIVLYPFSIDPTVIGKDFQDEVASGKLTIERVCWLDSRLEEPFREAIDILDLLSNETRIRMLLQLLERPRGKKQYRVEINPKLVYENLSSFLANRLISESLDNQYELSPLGRRLLAEYLTFLEKVKRALEET